MDPLAVVDSWPVGRVAVAAVIDGRVLSTRGDLDAVFELASVTKLLSAMAVLVAHEEGTIDLDDVVTAEGASVADLLAHAGGIAPDAPVPIMAPRSRRIYSTAAYDLVADHVVAAADMSFPQYVEHAVCEPLGMTATVLGAAAGADGRGSAGDLVRLMGAWRAPLLVDRSTLDRATSPHLGSLAGVLPGYGRQEPNPWGLGPELRGSKDPHWGGSRTSAATFGHFGRSGTLWWLDPEADRGVVALTDEPFGAWAIDAWPSLADAILSV